MRVRTGHQTCGEIQTYNLRIEDQYVSGTICTICKVCTDKFVQLSYVQRGKESQKDIRSDFAMSRGIMFLHRGSVKDNRSLKRQMTFIPQDNLRYIEAVTSHKT